MVVAVLADANNRIDPRPWRSSVASVALTEKSARQVDGDHVVPSGFSCLKTALACVPLDTSAMHQNIEASVALGNIFEDALSVIRNALIVPAVSDAIEFLISCGVDIGHDHNSTFLQHASDRCGAEPTSATCHERDLASHSHWLVYPTLSGRNRRLRPVRLSRMRVSYSVRKWQLPIAALADRDAGRGHGPIQSLAS